MSELHDKKEKNKERKKRKKVEKNDQDVSRLLKSKRLQIM